MIKCYACKLEKAETEFNRDSSRKNGYSSICKLCEGIRRKAHYSREKKAEYYQEHREDILRKHADYFQKNKDRIREVKQNWVEHNRSRVHAYAKKWRSAHPELEALRHKIYRAQHPDILRNMEIGRRDKRHEYHRGRMLKIKYNMSLDEFNHMFEKQNGKCSGCGSTLEPGKIRGYTVDHDHSTGRVRGLLCSKCNLAIGLLNDNLNTLLNLVAYLKQEM